MLSCVFTPLLSGLFVKGLCNVADCEDNLPLFPGGSPVSPGDFARFGRQLIAEVESRIVQSLGTGLY